MTAFNAMAVGTLDSHQPLSERGGDIVLRAVRRGLHFRTVGITRSRWLLSLGRDALDAMIVPLCSAL
jgi:hypothetical protein